MSERTVAVIGAGLDLGAGRRGVDMGPSAIRYAGLNERLAELGLACTDWGNVETAIPEATASGSPKARFLDQIKEACERVSRRVAVAVQQGRLPIVLGGDHSVALGTLGGLASERGVGGTLWFDAHGDLNTPATTPSGNVHGMPLAAAIGLDQESFSSDVWPLPAVDPRRVMLIGTRQLDKGERDVVHEHGIGVYTMTELDRRGVQDVVGEALDRVGGEGFVHLSFDMDVIDPDVAPGVGTPVRGGLSYREAHLAMELVAEAGVLDSLEIVEVNPILDDRNETAKLAVELAASVLGARII